MIILILFSIFFFGHLPLSVFVSFLFLFLRSSLEECVDMSAPIVHDVFCDYQYELSVFLSWGSVDFYFFKIIYFRSSFRPGFTSIFYSFWFLLFSWNLRPSSTSRFRLLRSYSSAFFKNLICVICPWFIRFFHFSNSCIYLFF